MFKNITKYLMCILLSVAVAAAIPVGNIYGRDYMELNYLSEDESWVKKTFMFPSGTTKEDRIKIIYMHFFDKAGTEFYSPPHVKVLDVSIEGEKLLLDVSGEVLNIKGEYTERKFAEQIIKTAIGITGISEFVLLVEGRQQVFKDGTIVIYP